MDDMIASLFTLENLVSSNAIQEASSLIPLIFTKIKGICVYVSIFIFVKK